MGSCVHLALAVAGELSDEVPVEVFDPRTVCGLGAEVLATAAEEMRLIAAPRRVCRPDGAVLPFAPELDRAVQPGRDQLATAIRAVMK